MPSYGTRARHKYGAKKAMYGGVLYDSKSEAEYARTLDLRQHAGEIASWARADTFVLIPGGRAWRVTYTPDFLVVGRDGHPHYVEVKGAETEGYKMRLKVLRHLHPEVRLLIVRPDGTERWAW